MQYALFPSAPPTDHLDHSECKHPRAPLNGPFHLVQDTLSAPTEDDVRQLLFRTTSDLGGVTYDAPDLASVPVEWIGREVEGVEDISGASSNKRCDLDRLTKDCTADLTILHVHGGACLYGSTFTSISPY